MTGDELKQWMREHGRTVRGLAWELGVSNSTIHRWRSGDRTIPKSVELALVTLARRRPPQPGTGDGGA